MEPDAQTGKKRRHPIARKRGKRRCATGSRNDAGNIRSPATALLCREIAGKETIPEQYRAAEDVGDDRKAPREHGVEKLGNEKPRGAKREPHADIRRKAPGEKEADQRGILSMRQALAAEQKRK